MKTKITIILIVFSSIIGYSQTNEFAPIGAKWTYERTSLGNKELTIIESIKDTIIETKICKILKIYEINKLYNSNNLQYWDTNFVSNEFLYSDSNKIFHFDKIENIFYKLYDFNVQQGDTIIIRDSTFLSYTGLIINKFEYVVDSVSSVNINSNIYKVIYVSRTDSSDWSFSNNYLFENFPIIENIGSTKFLLGYSMVNNAMEQTETLRCYQDQNISFIADFWSDTIGCNYPVTSIINLIQSKSFITIYPIVFSDYVYINNNNNFELTIIVTDILGNCLFTNQTKSNNIELNLKFLIAGSYIIRVYNSNNQIVSKKIIKN